MTQPKPSPASDNEPGLQVDTTDPTFADAVVSDVQRIRQTRAGRTLFRRLRDAGIGVTIVVPAPPRPIRRMLGRWHTRPVR
jgi:hypothetical protein